MKPGAHIILLSAARFYTPLIVLAALALLLLRDAGTGAGFIAGLVFAAALAAHLLVFGAAAARRAFPSTLARVLAALGLIATLVGAAGPRLAFASQLVEGGLFALTVAGVALVLTVIVGRAPTLRDEEA